MQRNTRIATNNDECCEASVYFFMFRENVWLDKQRISYSSIVSYFNPNTSATAL